MALSEGNGFLSPTYIIKGPFTMIALEFFLYGFYLLLFFQSIHIFNKRKSSFPQAKFYFNSIVFLFVLATTELVFDAVYKVQRSLSQLLLASRVGEVSGEEAFVLTPLELGSLIITFFTHCFGNAIADAVLIHRLYVTWNSKRLVLIIPIISSCAVNLLLLGSSIALSITKSNSHQFELTVKCNTAFGVALGVNAVFNVILTLSISGRIWWITRDYRAELGDHVERYYNRTITIILESGIIYPIFVIIHLIVYSRHETIAYNMYSLLIQAAGIAPTLIVVRAALGISVQQRSTEVVSSFRAAEVGSLFQVGAPVVIDVNVGNEADKASTRETRV